MPDAAMILGLAGTALTPDERAFFKDARPFGFILFARNIEDPDQVRALTDSLRALTGRDELAILIDQEGGRVQRLRAPAFDESPPAGDVGALAENDMAAAERAAFLHALLIGAQLSRLGITVDCLPCLDLLVPGASSVIGDRAYGSDPSQVARLGAAAIDGLRAAGQVAVIKHLPGHGRALVDSHHELPRLDASLDLLRDTDFAPFRACALGAWGMTGHLLIPAVDPDEPVTLSAAGIGGIIRREIGFDGPLMSDDLSMKALTGTIGALGRKAIEAGCDIALHCNGDMAEMMDLAENVSDLTADAVARLKAVPVTRTGATVDLAAARAEFSELLSRNEG